MKTLENKKVKIESKGEVKESFEKTYGELIFIACNRPNPQGVFSYEDMKKIKRIEDVISNKKEGETINFEDADFLIVKERVLSMGWGINSEEIFNFIEHIDSIK